MCIHVICALHCPRTVANMIKTPKPYHSIFVRGFFFFFSKTFSFTNTFFTSWSKTLIFSTFSLTKSSENSWKVSNINVTEYEWVILCCVTLCCFVLCSKSLYQSLHISQLKSILIPFSSLSFENWSKLNNIGKTEIK